MRRHAVAPSSCGASTGCRPPEGGPQQAIDFVPNLLAWQAVAELQFDEPDEQRIERAPGGQELLCDFGEWIGASDHSGDCGDLPARPLGVADCGDPLIEGVRGAHCRTKTAPVIPAAA